MEGATDGVYKEESLEVVRNFVFEAARACDLSLSTCTSYNNPVIFLIASSAGPSPILHAMPGGGLPLADRVFLWLNANGGTRG